MSVLLGIIFGVFSIIQKILALILRGIWKLMTDVMRGVYGKVVAVIVSVVFIALLGGVVSIFQIHS